MNAKDVMKHVVEFCHTITREYLGDLTDNQLLVRSVVGANHIAWQLGHLISSDHEMLTHLGHTPPPLPEDFAEAHTKETASSDDPAKFYKMSVYLELMDKMKAATLAAIDATPEETLEQPSPEPMQSYAPTIGAALSLLGMHWLMHAGQFVPIRRKLGKLPLF